MAQNPPSSTGSNDSAVLGQSLDVAMAALRNSPAQWSIWERAERLAVNLQRTDDLANLYREVLAGDLTADVALKVGERAAHFHEEWAGDDPGAMITVLQKVLSLDPGAIWAFDQLTAVLTLAGRWDELLALYDRALTATNDRERRMMILDEAAGIAKDFAGQVTRAIRYLQQLVPLRPEDDQLAASLERLLDREERWQDLIDLWRERGSLLGQDAPVGLKIQIATCFVDRLGRPAEALIELQDLLDEHPGDRGGRLLLERILVDESTPDSVRDGALDRLSQLYEDADLPDEVIRILKVALNFADSERSLTLHRELAEREVALGREVEAMEHYAAILAIDPSLEGDHRELRHLSERTAERGAYVNALVVAADAAKSDARRIALLLEAANASRDQLADQPQAIDLFTRILGEPSLDDEVLHDVAHDLAQLLGKAERFGERMEVLERLASVEPEVALRTAILGEVAEIAASLGNRERALAAWHQRLELNGDGDREALDAIVDLVAEAGTGEPLIAALERRANAGVAAHQRLADLTRIAQIYDRDLIQPDDAIALWSKIQAEFGEDENNVEPLAALLAEVKRWPELASLLDRAAEREVDKVADLASRLGMVYQAHLGELERAMACFARAIEADPAHKRAREGLRALLNHDQSCAGAVDALVKLHSRRDEHAELAGLVEFRLAVSASAAAKAAILHETAKIQEERLGDASVALTMVQRAFALAPLEQSYEDDFVRLFSAAEDWRVGADGYKAAIEALPAGNGDRLVVLRTREAELLEERLRESTAALSSWRAVVAMNASDRGAVTGVVRTATRIGLWEPIADDTVAYMRSTGVFDEELVAMVEAAAEDKFAWDPLAKGYERAVGEELGEQADLAAALLARVGAWHRDHRDDADAAKLALGRSLEVLPGHVARLEALVELMRSDANAALIDTLLTLAGRRDDNCDELYEAAELALDILGDQPKTREILTTLRDRAAALWSRGAVSSGSVAVAVCVEMAIGKLAGLAEASGELAEAITLLARGANLPFETEVSLGMRRKAAALCVATGDQSQAIDLYSAVIEEMPEDLETVRKLSALIEAQERYPELLLLRQHELARTGDGERRLQLRLDIAKIVGILEVRGGRLEALKTNLEEEPAHDPSLAALTEILTEKGDFGHLADFLGTLAGRLETAGDSTRAARLWSQVADLSEARLDDLRRSIAAHERVASLEDSAAALDALARLHIHLGEPAAAVPWIQRRIERCAGDERTGLTIQLAEAQVAASQVDDAVAVLAEATAADPTVAETRELLADLYRTIGSWEPLAEHLLRAAENASEPVQALAFLREAAEIYTKKLGALDRAIPVFEHLCGLDPSDRETRVLWVDGLLEAGRIDEARTLLEEQIVEFGRRRSAERAGLHYRLARILREQGRPNEAMAQLDRAAPMAPAHLGILRMLAEVSYEMGETVRAERAFRALLLAIRRRPDDEEAEGVAEVQYELSRLAAARGQDVQARELNESAIAVAMRGGIEAKKLQRALKAHGDHEQLAALLEVRLREVIEDAERGEILAELANLREVDGKPEDAFELRLKALADDPSDAALLQRTYEQAVELGQLGRYIDVLQELLEKRRRKEDSALAANLWLRLAAIAERELKDFERAAAAYASAEETGERLVEAWIGLARIAAAQGDAGRQAALFEKIAALPPESMTAENRAQAAYGLAELRLADSETRDAGVEALAAALAHDGRYDLAEPILRRARALDPENEAIAALFAKTLRALDDVGPLLDFLAEQSEADDAEPGIAHEAAELALAAGEDERAEALLARTITLAQVRVDASAHHGWALLTLAQRRRDSGDLEGAVGYLRDASEVGVVAELFAMGLSLAAMAVAASRLDLGAELYETLLEKDRSNREVWAPLMQLYRELEEDGKLQRLVEDTLDTLTDVRERNSMRMELARVMSERSGSETEAVRLLRDVLSEDPSNVEAEGLLAELFERTGYDAELSQLLQHQLNGALERDDMEVAVAVALRLGELLRASHLDEAIVTYRRALAAIPNEKRLIEALLALLGDDHDPKEKIELKERLAASATGEAAIALAFEVAELWESQGDMAAAIRVLQRAYAAESDSEALRSELEGYYRASEDWENLAAHLVYAAEREPSPAQAAAIIREVAEIRADHLGDPSGAIMAIRYASGRSPQDLELIRELATMLGDAGEHESAIAELSHAIDWLPMSDETMLDLLKERAELRTLIEDEAGAVNDLEEAYRLVGAAMVGELMAALESLRAGAARRGDLDAERRATLRLVDILSAEGGVEQARQTLAQWAERAPKDVEVLRRLLLLDTDAERWDAVIATCNRLIDAEEGDSQVDAGLRLVEACEKAGRAGDARIGLERVYKRNPDNRPIRTHLKKIYEEGEDYAKIAQILISEAKAVEDEDERFLMLRQAGELLIDEDSEAAAGALKQALELRPTDQTVNLLLVEAYSEAGDHAQAGEILDAAIEAMRGRRSPELCMLQYQKAKVAHSKGDRGEELQLLKEAYHSDRNNGDVAIELADLAEEMEDYDLAIRVLRSIALMEAAPITRAVAYLRQGIIADKRGDRQKAVLWGRKALMEDPNCQDATDFLSQIGEL